MRYSSPDIKTGSRMPAKVSSFRAYFSFSKSVVRYRLAAGALCLLVAVSLGAVLPASQALAVTKTSTLTPGDQASSFAYYKALRTCMAKGWYKNSLPPLVGLNTMSQEDAVNFTWFNSRNGLNTNGVNVGAFNNPRDSQDDGSRNCGDDEGKAWIAKAAQLWGYSSGPQLLCDLGFTRNKSGVACASTTSGATNDYVAPSNGAGNLDALWQGKLGNSSVGIGSITDMGGAYALYLKSFTEQCRPAGGTGYTIQTFDSGSDTPTTPKAVTFAPADRDRGKDYSVTIYDQKTMTCGELAAALSKPDSAVVLGYIRYLKANGGKDESAPPTPGKGCTSGAATDEAGNACTAVDNPTSCSIEGIGWIVCPVITFVAGMTDVLYGWISNYLKVQPLNLDTSSSSNTMYIAWTSMRNIANVAFVIAFLIIIMSQLTGAGVSNYGVKKLLPRLVIAAILVNVSYWVSAIAVDVSNIVGSSLYGLLRHNVGLGDIIIESNAWETLSASLLSGGVLTGVVIGGSAAISAGTLSALGPVALYAFIVFLLGIILALVIAFIILALRQAVIIILIVVSPLAFVAMLLPNTEKYFSLWRKSLTTLLMFYPLFSLLFGGSYLAGMIIIGSATTVEGGDSATGMTVLIGMIVTILPLWITPLIVRFSTGILGQAAGIVNNKNRGLIDGAKKVRNRKANLAMHETLGSSNATRNPFTKIGRKMYRRMDVDTRQDADRKKVADNNNVSAYNSSVPGSLMSYETELANQKVEASSSYNKARFEESKSSSQAISPGHPQARQIQEARNTQEEIDIAHNRINSAKSVLQQELAEELRTRPGMASRAGGIDPRGQSRVVAAANATIADAESKAIAAEKSTMTRSTASQLDTIMRDTSASAERRAAAAGQIVKVGADSDIHSTLDYLSTLAGTPDGITIQQQAAADIGARKPLAIGAADSTALGLGQYSGTFDTKIASRLSGGKVSAEALNSASADELNRWMSVIPTLPPSDPERVRLRDAIASYKASASYRAPSSEIAAKIDTIQGML